MSTFPAADASESEWFFWLCAQSQDHVPGILRIRKGNPIARSLVLLGTHGREIASGLAAVRYMMHHQRLLTDHVDLTFAIGNIYAALLYYQTEDKALRETLRMTPGGKDMNRQPLNLEELKSRKDPEARRTRDLLRAIPGAVNVLDTHSTGMPSAPAGLAIAGHSTRAMSFFTHMPLEEILLDVAKVQSEQGKRTQPLAMVFNPRFALTIEAGQTGSDECNDITVNCFFNWAHQLGIIDGKHVVPRKGQNIRRVVASVLLPDLSYEIVDEKYLVEKTTVHKGEVLARNPSGETINAPCDGNLLWVPTSLRLPQRQLESELFWFTQQG